MAKLLLVEDDLLLSKMYRQKFEMAGFSTDQAFDGQQAVDRAKLSKPDIILMDVMMPKLNGVEALTRIKSDNTTKNIPVIMLTNLSGTQDAENALKLGAVSYLVKSDFTPTEVVAKVKQLLETKK